MFTNKNNKKSFFYVLLEKDGSVSIHKQNSRFLACSQRPWKFKLLRSKNLESLPLEIKKNRDFVTTQS